MIGVVACFMSLVKEGCCGDDRTYRIEPLLATLSTLPNRDLLARDVAESSRLPIVDDLELLLSTGKFGVLWSSIMEPGEKTRDPSDPSES